MMTDLTSKPLTRKQINYAIERCKRIASMKKVGLDDEASRLRKPELCDYDRVMMIRDGKVTIDVTRLKVDRNIIDRHYYAPRVTDCADFSAQESEIKSHNKAVDKALKKARLAVERRAAAILDRFELGEPSEALQLLTEFDAQEFSL